jgi:hypothetical protein
VTEQGLSATVCANQDRCLVGARREVRRAPRPLAASHYRISAGLPWLCPGIVCGDFGLTGDAPTH